MKFRTALFLFILSIAASFSAWALNNCPSGQSWDRGLNRCADREVLTDTNINAGLNSGVGVNTGRDKMSPNLNTSINTSISNELAASTGTSST